MNLRLAGKRCLITAAGRGIGHATALAFAREGASVIATDIDGAALGQLQREHRALSIELLDVTDARGCESLAERLGAIDILFNCAGYVHQGSILECPLPEWERSFRINVDGMYHLCRTLLPGMLARRHGSIINMSSVASSIKGVANRFAYSVTKAAVIGLTKSIAADCVGRGVRCNAICPGTIDTPSLGVRVAALGGDPDEKWRSFIDRQPMGRLGTPAEVASLAVYLGSDESLFTTGQIHIIDGGWAM